VEDQSCGLGDILASSVRVYLRTTECGYGVWMDVSPALNLEALSGGLRSIGIDSGSDADSDVASPAV
jgi:hypothetical protein